MAAIARLKNRIIARLVRSIPALGARLAAAYAPWQSHEPTPWSPPDKPLAACKVAVVTTAGVHHRSQPPFDMHDRDGDPSFRELDAATIADNFTITHDYYDHSDAERDLNIVLPLDRLREFAAEGVIGALAESHYAFMGHIDGRHILTLMQDTARQVAARLRQEQVDAVLLTPA
jgi:D-proline reductase (dithiol) PrdB